VNIILLHFEIFLNFENVQGRGGGGQSGTHAHIHHFIHATKTIRCIVVAAASTAAVVVAVVNVYLFKIKKRRIKQM
jgi:hypothetical protein